MLGTIEGGLDFEQLATKSSWFDLGDGLWVRILDLETLVRLTETSTRPKDVERRELYRRTLKRREEE